MAIILIFVIILTILGGFLVYFKFLNKETQLEVLFNNRNYKKIIEIVSRNKNLLQKSPGIRFIYGLSLYNFNHFKDAYLILSPLLKVEKIEKLVDYEKLLETLADSMFQLGIFKESFYYYYKLLKFNPNNKNAVYYVARIYAGANRLKKAVLFYEDYKKFNRHNPIPYFELALLYLLNGYLLKATKNFRIAYELDKKNIDYTFFYSVCLYANKRIEHAISMMKDLYLKEIKPEYKTELARMLGNMHQRLNVVTIAINYYEEFLANRNTSIPEFLKDTLYYLSLGYFKVHDTKNAIRALQILYNIDKKYKDIEEILYNKDTILTSPSFIEVLESWSNLVEFKPPVYLSKYLIIIDEKLDLKTVEEEIGIIENKENYTIEDYLKAKYQEWLMINEYILSMMDFKHIAIYRKENDPDIFSGTGCYFTGEKMIGGKLYTFLVKFYRENKLNIGAVKQYYNIKEQLNLDRLAIFYPYSYSADILNYIASKKDIEIYGKNSIITLIKKKKPLKKK